MYGAVRFQQGAGRVRPPWKTARWRTWLAFFAIAAVAFFSLAGFGVHPDDDVDRESLFRCAPPVVSAFSHSSALERVKDPALARDSTVEVECRPAAQRRLYVAGGAAIASGVIFMTSQRGGRPIVLRLRRGSEPGRI